MTGPHIEHFLYDKFHPLDHRIGDRRCRTFYGGWRIHLYYWWEFKFKAYFWPKWIHLLGIHTDVEGWDREGHSLGVVCIVCGRQKD